MNNIEEFVICANVCNQVLFVEEKPVCFGVQTLKSLYLHKCLESRIVGGRKARLF
jgi:hypothetical protein